MSAMRGGSSTRPSLDRLDTSMSNGSGAHSGDGNTEEEDTVRHFCKLSSSSANANQVDSVMNKLAIERKVQYGAEKMLDVS